MILFVGGFFGVFVWFCWSVMVAWGNRRSARVARLVRNQEIIDEAQRIYACKNSDEGKRYDPSLSWRQTVGVLAAGFAIVAIVAMAHVNGGNSANQVVPETPTLQSMPTPSEPVPIHYDTPAVHYVAADPTPTATVVAHKRHHKAS